MSDFSDVLFDPREHTHDSCVREIEHCDAVILIIGSRFGGKGVPTAVSAIDFEQVAASGADTSKIKDKSHLSITQLEVLKALEGGIPVFAFVDQGVYHDHNVYEKNKGKPILAEIVFPSIEKQDTAPFIFEFINFVRLRARGNAVLPFAKIDDIEEHLRKQWSALFQRLLREQRDKSTDAKRIEGISDQLEELKTAILSSIKVSNADAGAVARGVIRFRRLVDFVRDFEALDLLTSAGPHDFAELMARQRIQTVAAVPGRYRPETAFVREDGSGLIARFPPEVLETLRADWDEFMGIQQQERRVIVEALNDLEPRSLRNMRKVDEPIADYLRKRDDASDRERFLTAAHEQEERRARMERARVDMAEMVERERLEHDRLARDRSELERSEGEQFSH